MFVSSLINKAIYKGLARFTGLPFFEEAHFRHFNQLDLYIDTVEGAFDPSCKRRRPGTKRRYDWSRKEERLKQKQGVISKPFNLNRCLIIKPKREKIPPNAQTTWSSAKSAQNHEPNLATNTAKSGQKHRPNQAKSMDELQPKTRTKEAQTHVSKNAKNKLCTPIKACYATRI